MESLTNLFKRRIAQIFLFWFLCELVYWVILQIYIIPGNPDAKLGENIYNLFFSVPYFTMGVIGGLNGLRIAAKWNGWHSKLGRALIFLSLAILAQNIIGNFLWLLYYNMYLHTQVPYPALTDIGYFSVIPLNALAIYYFGQLSGAKFELKKLKSKAVGLLTGYIFFSLAYVLFIQHVKIDFVNEPIRTFLDLGYPLGEAFNISFATIILLNSAKSVGGAFKVPFLFVIFHFALVFLGDNSFIFAQANGLYYNSSFVDLIYAMQCFTGAIALIFFENLEPKTK